MKYAVRLTRIERTLGSVAQPCCECETQPRYYQIVDPDAPSNTPDRCEKCARLLPTNGVTYISAELWNAI